MAVTWRCCCVAPCVWPGEHARAEPMSEKEWEQSVLDGMRDDLIDVSELPMALEGACQHHAHHAPHAQRGMRTRGGAGAGAWGGAGHRQGALAALPSSTAMEQVRRQY